MCPTPEGLAPATGYLEKQLLKLSPLPDYDFIEFTPLLDSSSMSPMQWNEILKNIFDHYESYTGFVVIHGTDTLAYTSAALHYGLNQLQKPVVVTGSMLPIGNDQSDAEDNLRLAMSTAANWQYAGVSVAFSGQLFPGNNVSKTDSSALDAFSSPAQEAVLKVSPDTSLPLAINRYKDTDMAVFYFFPGADLSVLRSMLKSEIRVLILKTYGAGNVPESEELREILVSADSELIIVNSSQCLNPNVDTSIYASGSLLTSEQVVSGGNLCHEALTALLLMLTSQSSDNLWVREQFKSRT